MNAAGRITGDARQAGLGRYAFIWQQDPLERRDQELVPFLDRVRLADSGDDTRGTNGTVGRGIKRSGWSSSGVRSEATAGQRRLTRNRTEVGQQVRWRPHRDSNCTEPANHNPATTHAKAEFARESEAADRQERLDRRSRAPSGLGPVGGEIGERKSSQPCRERSRLRDARRAGRKAPREFLHGKLLPTFSPDPRSSVASWSRCWRDFSPRRTPFISPILRTAT
jgi:hypothetical protein